MTSLAIGYREARAGRQQSSDGLLKHLGLIDAGSLRIVDNQLAPVIAGKGVEVLFTKSNNTGTIQVIDRDAVPPVALDLSISARNIAIFPANVPIQMPAGAIDGANIKAGSVTTTEIKDGTIQTADIAANAVQQLIAQYVAPTAWSTTLGPWVETVVQATGTSQGGLLRIEYSFPFYCTVAGVGIYLGVGWDGTAGAGIGYWNPPVASYAMTQGGVYYVTLAAGSHRFALFAGTTGGTLTLQGASNATLFVTEQKR